MGEVGRVEDGDLLVEPGRSRAERETNFPAGAEALLDLADHERRGPVLVLDSRDVHRRITGHRVALGTPVPLDAARDPGAPERDQAGPDDPVVVEHLFVLALVEDPLDAAPDLGKTGHLQVLVLEEERPPGVVGPFRAEVVLHRVGIDDGVVGLAELRVRIVGKERVGRESQFTFPDADRLLGRRGNGNGGTEKQRRQEGRRGVERACV